MGSMRTCSWVALLLLIGCAAGDDGDSTDVLAKQDKKCKQHKWKDKSHGDCSTATATIGVAGGTLTTASGLVLEVPFGALDGDTTLTVSTTDAVPPADIGAVSPVYEFTPDGIVFATPVKVTLPMPAGVTAASVYWSRLDGSGFDPIGGTIANGTITVETVHFSLAVIGAPSGTRTVTGVARDTWISATDRRTLPADLAPSSLEALVSDGAGGFASIPGTYAADGTFTIPGVPVGDYILHAQSGTSHLMIVTDSNTPDLGRKHGGKPMSERTPLTTSTVLDLTVDGLEPWEVGDSVELFSTQVDDWVFGVDIGQAPAAGATSAALPVDMLFAANEFGPAAIDGAAGDVVTVAQLTARTSATGVRYQAMTRLANLSPTFALPDGATVPATVTLAPLLVNQSLSVDFRGTAFASAVGAYGHPSDRTCVACGGFVGALAQAGSAEDGFYTANADLMLMNDLDRNGSDLVSGALSYAPASALGGTWGELYHARWTRRHAYMLDGTSGPQFGLGGAFGATAIDWTTTKALIEAAPIVPPMTPVQSATVNGVSFFTGAASIGTTTTVTWTPPATGTPLFYQLRARELFVRPNGRTGARLAATVSTRDTSFTFPPGILDPTRTYVFAISATASTSADPGHGASLAIAPFKSTNEITDATMSSGVFGAGRVLVEPYVLTSDQVLPIGLARNATALFWTEYADSFEYPPVSTGAGRIWTANLDGTNPHVIVTGADGPYYIAATDTHVYWTQRANGADASVQVYDLATQQVSTLVTQEGMEAIAVAPNGDVVFSSWLGTQVLRGGTGTPELLSYEAAADLACDGTNVYIAAYSGRVLSVPLVGGAETELASGQPDPWNIKVDGTHVYWTNAAWGTNTATLNRVPIGGGAPALVTSGNGQLRTFAIDGGYAYFVVGTALRRVPLAGGTVEPVGAGACPDGQMIAFDGKVAWQDVCNNRTNLWEP